MKFIDEVDIELVNQALNFHSQDNNLVIRGGCDLFTTKPIGADRKLFKTIDKRLDQILEDLQFLHLLERERRNSVDLVFGSSVLPPGSLSSRRGSYAFERNRRTSSSLITFPQGSAAPQSMLKSFNDELAIDESPFGPLKNVTSRKTFAYLIAILNTTYPDHDFLNLQPLTENFHKMNNAEELIHKFNNVMVLLGKKEDLLNWIWDTVNLYMDVIPNKSGNNSGNGAPRSRNNSMLKLYSYSTPLTPADLPTLGGGLNQSQGDVCQIYEFQPSDELIIEDLNYPYQTMWLHYWFIYNKKKKRVLFLYLNAINMIHYLLVNSNRILASNQGSNYGHDEDAVVDDDDEAIYEDDYIQEEFMEDDEDMNNDVIGDLEI